MNWIDSHRRVDEGVTVGNCRENRFLFADELVLLFADEAGTKISTKKLEVLCLS